MPIRTGKEFLAGLNDDRQIFMDGDRIADVTRDKRMAGAAQSLAELFDMQHDPALHAKMTFASPSSGQPVGLSFIEPRSVDDLIAGAAWSRFGWMRPAACSAAAPISSTSC